MEVDGAMVTNQEKPVEEETDENDNGGDNKISKKRIKYSNKDVGEDGKEISIKTLNGDVVRCNDDDSKENNEVENKEKDEQKKQENKPKTEDDDVMEVDDEPIVLNDEKMDESENSGEKAAKTDGKLAANDDDVIILDEKDQNGEKTSEDAASLKLRKEAEECEQRESESAEQKKKSEDKNGDDGKEQTIIITETKSLAKAINEAVKKPDGKPTLVIIESKSKNDSSPAASSNGASSPGSGMTLRPRTKVEPTPAQAPTPAAKTSKSNSKSDGTNVALRDDAEITIYTPSVQVPYLYESSPKENLADFVAKLAAAIKKPEVEDKKNESDEKKSDDETTEPEPKKEKTFFDTTLGQFFIDIGLLQAQHWVQHEVLKSEKRKLDKGWSSKERRSMVNKLTRSLEDIKPLVQKYKFQVKTCSRCDFKTESQTVLDRHLETIHVTGTKMICSYCDFNTTEPSQIFHHLYATHKAFGRLERPLALHQCPNCPMEDSAKARVTRHMWKCGKNFMPDKNQAPSSDFEPPAKRVRHVATVATLKAMRTNNAGDKTSAGNNNQQQQLQNRNTMQRAPPPPIRPKPGDLRLSPAYVQSVLRGQYMSQSNVRGMSPGILNRSQANSPAQRNLQQTSNAGSYMMRQSNPVITSINSLNNTLQASQLFQVISPSTAGGLVPLVRGGSIGSLNAQRFTILPTPQSSTANNRGGPTPVALIPNLASKSTSLSSGLSSSQQQIRVSQAANVVKSGSQKPNISITPVNKQSTVNKFNVGAKTAATSGSSGASPLNRPTSQNNQQQQQGANSMYVVCEICDGYIKDLDQLRNHMQWIHKVKIHPKMIHNRPPLNCQKCHFRFFTDQGLERHLLGSHGLVTSSMQENANKGKDGGRCIICGKVFLWKLVVHMAKDHKMTLKPAHLSYKCTVCSATFNMYRLFESHVYDEHSSVAKRVLDGQKAVTSSASSVTSSLYQGNTRSKMNSSQPLNFSQPKRNEAKASTPTTTTSTSSSSNSVTKAAASEKTEKSSNVASTSTPVSVNPKPATSRITLHAEPRVCDDCGVTFKRGGNCDRHWEPTKLKPCNASLCRVDKCDACLKAPSSSSSSATKSNSKTPIVVEQQTKSSANGKATDAEKPKVTKVQSSSDGEDVFDMEVETVDENGSSPGYAQSDVESD